MKVFWLIPAILLIVLAILLFIREEFAQATFMLVMSHMCKTEARD